MMNVESEMESGLEALLSAHGLGSPEGLRRLSDALDALGDEAQTEEGVLLALAAVGAEARWHTLPPREVEALVEARGALLVVDPEGTTSVVRATPRGVEWSDAEGSATTLPSAVELRCLVLQPSVHESLTAGPISTMQRLWAFIKPDRRDLLAVILFAVVLGVLNLATPIAVQALVNFVALGGAAPQLLVVAGLLLLGLTFGAGLAAVQAWVVEILQRRLFVRVVADLAGRLPHWSEHVLRTKRGSQLVHRFFDVITIQKTSAHLLLGGITIVLSVVTGLLVLAFYHPLLLVFDLVLLLAITLIVLGPLRRGVRSALEESRAKYDVAAWFDELASQPMLFRSAGLQSWLRFQTDRFAREYLEQRRSHYRVLFSQIVAAGVLHVLASTSLLVLGGWLVLQGSLTLGQLVAAELIVTLVVGSVSKIGKHLESFYDLVAAVEKVGGMLEQPLEPTGGTALLPGEGALSLDLQGVQLEAAGTLARVSVPDQEIPAGARVAVLGPTTAQRALMRTLWGFRPVSNGRVLLGGLPLSGCSRATLRRDVVLLGPPEVLKGSVLDNVRAGRPRIAEIAVRASLEKVGILADVEALPEGLATTLGPTGSPLGPDQLRALMVARALVDSPRLVLVESELASLTGPLRKPVLDALCDPAAPWTLLVAAHDPELVARLPERIELPAHQLKSA